MQSLASEGPVFVDPSGRRARWLVRAAWALGSLMAVYTALVIASLVVPAGVLPLSLPGIGRLLPGPAAPQLAAARRAHHAPRHVLTAASPSADATATATAAAGGSPRAAVTQPPRVTPTTTATARTRTLPSTAATAAPSAAGAPTAQPTTTHAAHGRATSHPTPQPTGHR